ncbi:4-oxalocrotonate tautomerase family protein [Streptomyces sp. NPDC050560]|uniref:4-oxalocrotonate tautomerase family protein n=1 Tax=Streptomyces sp. NPDC050560 TaxID=3365630 RepID=UPI003799F4F7
MPRIVVQAIEGRSLEQKRHLVRALTDGIVEAFSVTPESVTVVIEEIRRDHTSRAGVLDVDRAGRAPAGDGARRTPATGS